MATYRIIGGDQKEYGPVSEQEIRRWIAEGRLNAQSLVQPEGSTGWQPLGNLPEFADVLRTVSSQTPAAGPPALPVNAEAFGAEVLARAPRLNFGACISRSWSLLQANFGLLFGATAVIWLIGLCQFIPLLGLIYRVLEGAFYGGLYLVFLKRIRGEPAQIGDVFVGFSLAFGQLVLASLISRFLSWIGMCFCLVPGIYLGIAWLFSVPLVADKRLEFWPAMELSRKVVTRIWFEMLGLVLVIFLPVILANALAGVKASLLLMPTLHELLGAGGPPDFNRLIRVVSQFSGTEFLLTGLVKLVLLINLPFALGALMYAYEDLFGARTTPAA